MTSSSPLTQTQRYCVLACALLAWLCAGLLMAMPPLAARQAVASMGVTEEAMRGVWFSRYVCAFLLGAATGGLLFGSLGDYLGRSKAMGLSVLTYSLLSGLCYFVTTPQQLLVVWFLACTGVGGVWPNGVSLASEAFPGMSRPWLSGVFGTAANFGLMLLALLVGLHEVTRDNWRWIMLVCAAPAVLGAIILAMLPESPMWLIRKRQPSSTDLRSSSPIAEVFRPPILKYTILGILLATVPMTGNWGATNWLVPWASKVQEQSQDKKYEDLSASTQWAKSSGAAIGGIIGGWIASLLGRRTAYFAISLIALVSSFYIFHSLSPLDDSFLTWVFVQGFFGTMYFGWMPLYFPELFPTRMRATGTGVAFNWGRIASAAGVLMGGWLMLTFGGDYARVGQVTCLVYALGMVIICFAPDTSQKRLEE
jgi:SHS family sialic acid transporter-like MFS transporter